MTTLAAFTAWFTKQGGYIHPRVEFAHSRGQGYILRVKSDVDDDNDDDDNEAASRRRPLPRNTTVLSCPHSLSLSALNAAHRGPSGAKGADGGPSGGVDVLPRLPEGFMHDARPQCVAAVWLCVQYLLGERSPWREYVGVLPRPPLLKRSEHVHGEELAEQQQQQQQQQQAEIDTAMWWGHEERAWIKGTNLYRGIEDLETMWAREWNVRGQTLREWATACGLPDLDWHLFKWAVSIYGSRAFSSALLSFVIEPASGQPVLEHADPHALLYPGMDMLNHNHMTRNRWFCDAERFGIVCDDEPALGDQVWNSYGKKGNGELLLSFGFALVQNINDAFALKLPPTPSTNAATPTSPATYDPATSAARLPATTRFPSDAADPSAAPYKTLSLDETDTLESHDEEAGIYYVRVRDGLPPRSATTTFTTASSVSSSSTSSKDNASYPRADGRLAHLAGFPVALLMRLAALLSNKRELATTATAAAATVDAAADAATATAMRRSEGSPNTIEAIWSPEGLGARNELAVSALLLSRLEMEEQRLQSLIDAGGPLDGERRGEGGTNEGEDGVKAQRRGYARVYVEGQIEILAWATGRLRRRVMKAVVDVTEMDQNEQTLSRLESSDANYNSGDRAHSKTSQPFLTTPRLLNCLRSVDPAAADDFVAGVFQAPEGADTRDVITERLDAIRRGRDDRDEEDILLLLVGSLYISLFTQERNSEADMENTAATQMKQWGFWHCWYGFDAGAASGFKSASTVEQATRERKEGEEHSDYETENDNEQEEQKEEDEDEDEEAIDNAGAAMQEEVASIRESDPHARLWSHWLWERRDFCKACVRSVTAETVSLALRRAAYDMASAAEWGGVDGAARRYLDDASSAEPGEDSVAEVMRVVVLYVAGVSTV